MSRRLCRVLVANRGEIAVRIVRACHDEGLEAIVTVSDADVDSLAARQADGVVHIGPPSPTQSYLRVEQIISAALLAGCDAVHPGYGFLSERPELAEACERHDIPRESYTATEGYFDQTLPPLGTQGDPTDIAICLIDCNMYTSAVTVFEFLEPRMKHGMILAFDDYFCWSPERISGEQSVLLEFARDHPEWHFERYRDLHRAGTSFVVQHADQIPR